MGFSQSRPTSGAPIFDQGRITVATPGHYTKGFNTTVKPNPNLLYDIAVAGECLVEKLSLAANEATHKA